MIPCPRRHADLLVSPVMLTFLAVFLRILVNPLSNVFQKRICAGGQSPLVANCLTYWALSFLVLPFAWNAARNTLWQEFPREFWLYSLLVGLFGAMGNGFLVKAVHGGELSVLGPINAWKSIVGIVFGVILLHEIPGLVGFFGVLLILAGSYFVIGVDGGSKKPQQRSVWALLKRPDLQFRIVAMIFAAIEAVFIKKVILHSDPNTAFVVWCFGGAIFSLLLLPLLEKIQWKTEWKSAKRHCVFYLGLVVSVGIMQLTTNYAFEKIPVGYALALFQLSAVLSVFYGWFFFHETQIFRKSVASLVMVAGSILIIFG